MRGLLLWGLLLAGQAQACDSLGLENHNPGNLRPAHWQNSTGAIGVDPWGHAIYKNDFDGLLACRKNVRAYGRRYHIKTVRAFVTRWIGPGNARTRHGALVLREYCQILKTTPDASLSLTHKATALRVTHAVVRMENGCDPYPEALYEQVFREP